MAELTNLILILSLILYLWGEWKDLMEEKEMYLSNSDLIYKRTGKLPEETVGKYGMTKKEYESRVKRHPDCESCKDPDWLPSHDSSSFCESGSRPHCTCDMCF